MILEFKINFLVCVKAKHLEQPNCDIFKFYKRNIFKFYHERSRVEPKQQLF